jgi:pimeloyl-[acyl-carrier protein] methyl ester esterase
MKNVKNNLFVETIGNGPNLVLIHGWGVHSGFWLPLINQLSHKFCITVIDLPGCGRSPLDSNLPYDLANVARQILMVAPDKAIWLGWSLGGLITTHIAAHYPKRVEKLICVASSPKFTKAPGWPGVKISLLDKLLNTISSTSEEILVRFLSLQFKNALMDRRNKQKMRDELFQYGVPNLAALQGGLEIIRNSDLREHLTILNCPTLYVLGKLDVLVPITIAEKIDHMLTAGHAHIIPRGCHAPFLSSTDDFIKTLSDFIK